MASTDPTGPWRCRAGLLFSRLFSLALAMLTVLAGVFAYFAGGQLLWLLASMVVSIWVGFKGAPLLLRFLEHRGVFGTVRVTGDRLTVGKPARFVDLTKPFDLEGRLQQSRIEREHDLRGFGPGGPTGPRSRAAVKSVLHVTVLTATIEQGGRRYHLVGDETNRHPGPDYDVDSLMVRRVAIGSPPARPVRLWGAHLAKLLAHLQAKPGCSPAMSPVPEKPLEDPRRAICPRWKTAAGAMAILLLFCAGAVVAFDAYEKRLDEETAARKAAIARERKDLEARCGALVGEMVSIDARRGVRLVGRVTSTKVTEKTVYDSEYRAVVRGRLTVEIDHLLDGDDRRLPDDAEIPFRHGGDIVRKGSVVEVGLDEAQGAE